MNTPWQEKDRAKETRGYNILKKLNDAEDCPRYDFFIRLFFGAFGKLS